MKLIIALFFSIFVSSNTLGNETAFSEICDSYAANSIDGKTCEFKLKNLEGDGFYFALGVELKFACQKDNGWDIEAKTSTSYIKTNEGTFVGTTQCNAPSDY